MEMWFSDIHTDGVKLSIRIEEQLFSAQSEVQRIDVLESRDFGKILVVDGDLMLTERDEFIYHEMITHVPMAVHPAEIHPFQRGCVRPDHHRFSESVRGRRGIVYKRVLRQLL